MTKWRLQLDSAHQKDPETPSMKILTAVVMHQKVVKFVGAEFRKLDRDVFANGATTSHAMANWMARLDSARQIGLESTLQDFLILGGCRFTEWEKR